MKGKGKSQSGRVGMKVSGNPDVFHEAEERKHGGKVHKKHGAKHKHKREHEHHHKVEGEKPHHRGDKPHRASGGRVGSDRSPLSSAHHGGKAGERAHGQPD